MLTARAILFGVAFPALIALIVGLLAHAPPWRRDAKTQPCGMPVAIAAAFVCAYIGIVATPVLRPVAVQGWLIHLCGGAVIIGVIALSRFARRWIEPILSIALLASAAWLLQPKHMRTIAFTAIAAAAMIAWWAAMEMLSRRRSGAALPALMAVFAASAALVLTDSGTQSLGQLAAAIAIVLAVFAAAAAWFRNLSLSHGGIVTIAVVLLGLILLGHKLADLTRRDMIILAAAPLALWVGELPPLSRRRWLRVVASTIALLAVLALAVAPAIRGLHKTMTEQTEAYIY